MDVNERYRKIATASPLVLERVDRVLEGREDTEPDKIALRTVTLTDAATRLGVSRPTIYRLVQRGELTTVLIGGLERIPLRALTAYATRPARRHVRTVV